MIFQTFSGFSKYVSGCSRHLHDFPNVVRFSEYRQNFPQRYHHFCKIFRIPPTFSGYPPTFSGFSQHIWGFPHMFMIFQYFLWFPHVLRISHKCSGDFWNFQWLIFFIFHFSCFSCQVDVIRPILWHFSFFIVSFLTIIAPDMTRSWPDHGVWIHELPNSGMVRVVLACSVLDRVPCWLWRSVLSVPVFRVSVFRVSVLAC